MRILITFTVVALLILVVLALVLAAVDAVTEDRIARAYRETDVPLNAAPAPTPPSRGPVRAPDRCMVVGCPKRWEVAVAGWRTCRGHDRRAAFDQQVEAAHVIDAARQITREAAS